MWGASKEIGLGLAMSATNPGSLFVVGRVFPVGNMYVSEIFPSPLEVLS
jgi:hypothetical protein